MSFRRKRARGTVCQARVELEVEMVCVCVCVRGGVSRVLLGRDDDDRRDWICVRQDQPFNLVRNLLGRVELRWRTLGSRCKWRWSVVTYNKVQGQSMCRFNVAAT